MKLSCALVLALTNLVIATPFSFSLKGSGSSSKVDPASATFGLVQPVGTNTGYSGTFSKPSSVNFASSSASESSGSFNYNAAQGTPTVAYNSAPGFGVPGQVVGQNVAVTPQTFTTAVPFIHNTGSSEETGAPVYYISKDVNVPFVSTPTKVQPTSNPDINIGYNPHAFVSQDIKPDVFPSAGPTLDSGLSGSLSSQYVSSSQVNTNTASSLPAGQQSGIYLGSTSHASETQGNVKPNTLVSGSPAYTTVSDSYNQEVQSVQVNTDTASQLQHTVVTTEQKPAIYLGSNTQTSVSQDITKPNVYVSNVASKESEKSKEWSAAHGFSSSVVNSEAVVSVPTAQAQATPTVEEKPVYSSGFGGPPGVLSPYDKASVSGVDIPASNVNTHPQNPQLSGSVSPTPQAFSYTPFSNPKPSYAFQQQQTLPVQPVQSFSSGGNYFASNAESSYKPEIKPTSQEENKLVIVNTNEKPSSELKPSNEVQKPAVQFLFQKPEVESPKKPEVGVEYPSQTITPGYQISIQTYPSKESQTVLEHNKGHIATESVEKVEETKKPLYTGGFGAPAGVLEPIQPTLSEAHKFAYTTFKPEQYEESKPTVEYTPTITEVNKYSSIAGEVKPTEKPYYETVSYQPLNVGSSPASYVTIKPTGTVSYSEQETLPFVSSTAGTVGAIGQKGEGQIISKPYGTIPVNPTFSSWVQNPTQGSVFLVQKPEIVEPVKPAVQVSSPSEPTFSKIPETFTTVKPSSYSYTFEGKNPTSPTPVGYEPTSVFVTKDETKPVAPAVPINQYESSQSGAVVEKIEDEKHFYQVYPTGSSFVSSTVASSYKPEETVVPFDKTKPSGTVFTSQKEVASVSDVKVSSESSEKINEKEIISPTFEAVKPIVSQNSALLSNTATGFVSVSQQPTNKPSFEEPSEKIPAFTFSGNPLTLSQAQKPSSVYIEQKEIQKPTIDVINKETPPKVPAFASNTYSGKIETQFSKKPTVTNQDKPSYSSSFGTLTGSTGYKPSSYEKESTIVTGSKDKVSQINFGTTVKPFVKPELSTLSQQTVVSTSTVSQNNDKQKQTESTFVQNKPSVVTSEGQKVTSQVFTTNSAVGSSETASDSKLQYQLPTIQPAVQKNPWYSNTFGAYETAKPYNNVYPGFTSSVTTYGQQSTQDKTKQTSQIISPGQYTPYSSGQYKPYSTGQYKPYNNNWGFNRHSSYQKYSNVYPTGGTFVSTYAPTTYKPFVTPSPFEKSKTSSLFDVKDNKEPTYVSGFPFSVTTVKPFYSTQTPTSYKPVQEPSVSSEHSEKSKVNKVVVPPKYEIPVSKPIETKPILSLNSESLASRFGQSSFSTVKPTANLLASSAQSEIVKPSNQSPSKVEDLNTNNESGLTAEVTKFSESSFTSAPVSQVTPSIQNKPYSGVDVGSPVVKPSSSYATQIKVDEKIQSSQTLKPYWSSEWNHKESSVGVGVTPSGLKPTEQPYTGTTFYLINKEVTPTQVSTVEPSSYGTFTLNTVSANKGDEKIQYSQTPKPDWSSSVSNQKESTFTVSVGEKSESLKPTGQSSVGTSSYTYNKEVTPTEVSAIKPSTYSTITVDTSSQNKLDEKVQFVQTLKPVWSSNQKVTSDSSKPTVQPSIGTSFYSINKVATPTQVDDKKPLSSGAFSTGLVTGNTNVGSAQSVLSSAHEGHSGVHLSSVEKWSSTAIPVVTHKPEYSVEQSSGHILTSSPSVSVEPHTVTVSGSEVTPKPLSAYETPIKPVFPKPAAQISTVEKKPAVVASYKEKDTNEASFVGTVFKPTVPSEHSTSVKVGTKYTDVPVKAPTYFAQPTQVPAQTNQQSLGFNNNAGASQSTQTSYVGGFGGPSGILKPNEFSQQQQVYTQYKPSYNNQYAWTNQQYPSGVNSNTGSYWNGRYSTPSGVWNENVKPNNGFGYVQGYNKWQRNWNQHSVFGSQASTPTTGGFGSYHHIQNPFNGGVSAGTGVTNNDYKLTGQFSGTKVLSTPQGSPATTVSRKVVASLL